jgi:hypothetical protein
LVASVLYRYFIFLREIARKEMIYGKAKKTVYYHLPQGFQDLQAYFKHVLRVAGACLQGVVSPQLPLLSGGAGESQKTQKWRRCRDCGKLPYPVPDEEAGRRRKRPPRNY